ncbi:MAG: PfaD family polyunsaturated fatty acid/polyketide biosynthesis protein [Thermoanaerobaculia bacterium]
MNAAGVDPAGVWTQASLPPAFSAEDLLAAIPRVRESVHVVREGERGRIGVGLQGDVRFGSLNGDGGYRWLAMLPPLYPEWLGDRSFLEAHQVRFPYVSGAMANGIATARLVIAMARARMLAFFGAAGLPIERVAEAIDEIEAALGPEASWGSNLIHSLNDPQLEDAIVDLYLRRGVRRVSASAFMQLTPAIVRYAASGLSIDGSGNVQRRNHVFAKISRPEVARRFLSPPPAEILRSLVDSGRLTAEEARLAAGLPIAEDVTVEADSGGHTDNQSLSALFPTILGLRDELAARHRYPRPIRVGAAGGLGTPAAVAAAFALGAAFVLTGSVNQSAVESGLSDAGKKLLAVAEISDVMMAPAADMFELGVEVQVLRRGTMFGVRARRLYELYRGYDSLEALPAKVRGELESKVFLATCDDIWAQTRRYFEAVDPAQVERAEREPKHRMALVFRWYLGKSSSWANQGDSEHRIDYQIWCGPAMGAFNAWVAGSSLAAPEGREVVQIARNLIEGAAVVTRSQQLRTYGVPVPAAAFQFRPRRLA